MKKIAIVLILLLTGCNRGMYQDHSAYYIDGESEYEKECTCECESDNTLLQIKDRLHDIAINYEDYSRNDMYHAIEDAYNLAKN